MKHVSYKAAVFKILSIIICDCYTDSFEATEKVSFIPPFLADATQIRNDVQEGILMLYLYFIFFLSIIQKIFAPSHCPTNL
jgi:hypothetical protein